MIETPAEILSHHASKEAADSFVAWRKKQLKKPLTETAALRIAKTLSFITANGGDASDALGMAEERGWQTIKAEWYFKEVKSESVNPRVASMAQGDRLLTWAEHIRSGKDFLCRNIPSTAAREMVHRGMVTPDQCKRVSVPL